jgi:hypothetical protein
MFRNMPTDRMPSLDPYALLKVYEGLYDAEDCNAMIDIEHRILLALLDYRVW